MVIETPYSATVLILIQSSYYEMPGGSVLDLSHWRAVYIYIYICVIGTSGPYTLYGSPTCFRAPARGSRP